MSLPSHWPPLEHTVPTLRRLPAFLLLCCAALAVRATPTPQVVVSIKPIHGLVAAVLADIATPALLLEGGASPHSYAMRPSQARLLEQADLVVWIGPDLETFLTEPLRTLARRARVLLLTEVAGMLLLPTRGGGSWEMHAAHDEHAGPDPHAHGAVDAHLWLDPDNAQQIVAAVTAALSQMDPDHARQYRANAARTAAAIDALTQDLEADLAPVRERPFVVFHDAYQYLEHRFGLRAVSAVTVAPDRPPGARRLVEVRERIRDLHARCVFTEPQFQPALAATVTEGTGARVAVLDPLGADLAPGPDAYFTLMRRLAASLRACLGDSGNEAR
jgi:zinc transport system substrate-binding protein